MHTDKQISRGMERLMCLSEGAALEGMFGLAGFAGVDNFGELESRMSEAGIAGARSHMKLLRNQHGCACERIRKALPVAVRATRLMEEAGEDGLSGVFSKIGKALKKVGKAAVKLSPSHALIKKVKPLKKISPAFRVAEGTTPLMQAAEGPPPPADPDVRAQLAANKLAKKEAKRLAKKAKKKAKADAKAAKALAKAGAGTQAMTPAEAGAAVLAQASQVPALQTPAGQAFAQDAVQSAAFPGSTIPDSALYNAPAEGEAGGISPVLLIGGSIAVLGVLYLFMRKKR